MLQVYSKMYSSIKDNTESANERNKFFMGTLFQIAGLLKVEAKSYLVSSEQVEGEDNEKAHRLACPISNPENILDELEKKNIRTLSADDKKYF